MAIRAFHASVEGEVQGVGFRYSAVREASSLGIMGWVRNAEDGTVEVWAEGGEEALDAFQKWLRIGPSAAWVRNVKLSRESPRGVYTTFGIVF
jgi:acylphosphatase